MFSASSVSCQFELTPKTRIFYSGDQVCGQITLTTTKKLHLKGIFLKLVGVEHTQWFEYTKQMPIIYDDSTTHNTRNNKIPFEGNKESILTTLQLSEEILLQPGDFVAKFSFNLPNQLLATCRQLNGYVDYNLQVVMQRENLIEKIVQERLFLRNRVDLNMHPHLRKPSTILYNDLIVTFPQTGFVPGQTVPFSIKMTQLLHNAKIVINLCQNTIYASQKPTPKTKETSKVLDYNIFTSAGSGILRIPLTTAISTAADNALIKISYHLECLVLNDKLEVVCRTVTPITIGTVALRGNKEVDLDECQCLHSYDNYGATKIEPDECVQYTSADSNFAAYSSQKCIRYKQKFSLMARKRDFQRLYNKLYRKIMT